MNNKAHIAWISLLFILTTSVEAATWQLGVLADNSQSPFVGDEEETSILPMVNYMDDRFSFVGGEFQYKLSSGDIAETYILGQMRSRNFYSASLDVNEDLNIEGMKDRNSAFELGLGLNNQTPWGKYVLQGVMDVSNSHRGYELTAKYSYPKQSGQWLFEPSVGLQLQSADLVNYYHGVMVSEAQDGRPAYRGSQAINTLTSLMVGYSINAQLLTLAGIEQLILDSSITDSPIVAEKQVRKIYLGLIYTF